MNLVGEGGGEETVQVPQDDRPDLQYFVGLAITVLRKYLLFSVPLALLAGLYAYDKATAIVPTYTARTIMHVAPSNANVRTLNSYYWGMDSAFQSTQLGILDSRLLMRQIVEDLQLHRRDVPPQLPKSLLERLLPSLAPATAPPEPAEPREMDEATERRLIERYAARLRGAVRATPDSRGEYSNLISVSATWHDASLAAEIANSTTRNYMRLLLEKSVEQAISHQQYLADRLSALREDLRASEERLRIFLDARNIDPIELMKEREVANISQTLLTTRSERRRLETTLEQVDAAGDDVGSVPAIRGHPRIVAVRDRMLALDRRRTELGGRYGPRHVRMIALEAEAVALERELATQLTELVASMRTELEVVRTNEAALETALTEASDREQSTSDEEFELFELQQDIEVKRGLLTSFTELYNQGDVSAPVENSNIWIVDPASVPRGASTPSATRSVLVAVFMSVVGVLGIGLLIELNQSTIGNAEELEKQLGVAHLCTLPLIKTRKSDPPGLPVMQYAQRQGSYFAESIRSLRTSLLLRHAAEGTIRLVITSTDANEGKSSVALNLGMAFGQMKRTLIVDCDLRRPSLERALNPNNPHLAGLTDVLAEEAALDDVLFDLEEDGVMLLPSGSRTMQPLELLSSPRFGMLLNELSDRFDVVVLDTPPCMAVSDAYVVSTHADYVVFVVKTRESRIRAMRSVLRRLRGLGVVLAGAVLNQVDVEASRYDSGREAYRAYRRYDDVPPEQRTEPEVEELVD